MASSSSYSLRPGGDLAAEPWQQIDDNGSCFPQPAVLQIMRDTKCFRVQIMKDQDKMQNEERRLATCQHAGVLTKAKDE
jgi:hypothetical protein